MLIKGGWQGQKEEQVLKILQLRVSCGEEKENIRL